MFTKVDAPGGKKPTPANPKGDRRSVLSEKEIQDSQLSAPLVDETKLSLTREGPL